MGHQTNLSLRYWHMGEKELRTLRSKKYNRKLRLESKPLGYFQIQEVRLIINQLKWIDAVLAARDAQLPLSE